MRGFCRQLPEQPGSKIKQVQWLSSGRLPALLL